MTSGADQTNSIGLQS